jgi:hypothetical protein
MALTELIYPTFAQLDADRLAALKELLLTVLQTYQPDIDLRRGTIHDLVLHPRALLTAQNEQAVLDALNSGSLSELIADPASAAPAAVDRTLGNYRLQRRAATLATGVVAIVVDRLTPVIVASGSVFTISGVEFVTDRVYAARTDESSVVAANDRLLTLTSSNDYLFTVTVVARVAAAAGNVRRGATATPANEPLGFVRAYADTDFSGGADAETNAELLARQQAGLAVRAWSNRPAIEAVMRDYTITTTTDNTDGTTTTTLTQPFAGLKAMSLVGMGDAEQLRDKHTLWPIATGSRADLYVRTEATYQTLRVRKTATLVTKVGAVGTWQLGLARADAPGYYEITKILLTTDDQEASGFAVAVETRSRDMSGSGWLPDVAADVESVYTRYQAATVQFADTTTNATGLTVGVAQQDYDVVLRIMPLIADLQDFWTDVNRRPPAGDILIKAAVPCFVSVAVTLNVRRGTTVDTAAVQAAVAVAINALSFTGSLPASLLNQTLHNLLGAALLSTAGMTLNGRLLRPDGTTASLTSATVLTVPDEPDNMVTGKTVAFLTEDAAVGITVVPVDMPGA